MKFTVTVEEDDVYDEFEQREILSWRYCCTCGKKSAWQDLSYANSEHTAWIHANNHAYEQL